MTDINTNGINNVNDAAINALYESTVFDSNGDKIGGVGQVYLDDVTGQPNWVTVNTGFLGMKESFIPLQGATVNGNEIRVGFDKELIKGAPGIDPDGHIDEAQEAELYRYYNLGDGAVVREDVVREGVDVDRDRVANADLADGEAIVKEERLNVGKEQVETGRARLRKHVVTEHQTVTVPVQREELVVERTPLNGEVVDGKIDGHLAEGETEVVLHEERPVVDKQVVATEKVSVGKQVVTENEQVSADIAKEQVEIVKDGDVVRDGVRDDLRDGDLNR